MSTKIKLPVGTLCKNGFAGALQRLVNAADVNGKLMLSGKDQYALSKVIKTVRAELESYNPARITLLKKYNAHSSLEPVRATLAALVAKGDAATPEEKKSLEGIKRKLPQLEAEENLAIYKTSPDYAEFMKELAELDKPEVELFLDHKLRIPLAQLGAAPETSLTAFDMEMLEPLVEFVEEAKAEKN